MSQQTVCVHRLREIAAMDLGDFRIIAHTNGQAELREALGVTRPRVLVINLDEEGATDCIVEALELAPGLCVVGVTDQRDPQLIISAVRCGCRQLTTKPVDLNDLIVTIRRALNETIEVPPTNRMVGVMSATGGAGGTTLACHLGLATAQRTGKPTLLIDLDLEFGGVARAFNVGAAHSIADLASSGAIDPVLLQKAAAPVKDGLAILARPKTIEEVQALDETLLSNVILTAKRTYPYIVLDLPRRLDAVTGFCLEECDKVLIVAQLTVPAIDNARRLMQTVVQAGLAEEKVAVVLNRYRKNVHNLTIEMAEKTLKQKLLGIIPNDFAAVSNAIDLGQPMDTRGHVYKAIAQICPKLDGQESCEVAQGGWFTRFRKRAASPSVVGNA
jgi:pilus assembly protein CpaE